MNKPDTMLSKMSDERFGGFTHGLVTIIRLVEIAGRKRVELSIGKEKSGKIMYRTKIDSYNKGQFGYYFNPNNVFELLKMCREYKIQSVIEIGSGLGVIGEILKKCNIAYKGIEIEKDLVDNSFDERVILGNIFDQKQSFYAGYESAYFWECFNDEKLNKLFFQHLKKTIPVGFLLFYVTAGTSLFHLLKADKEFKEIERKDYSPITIFKRIRKKRIL
jgi:hypothetical protein